MICFQCCPICICAKKITLDLFLDNSGFVSSMACSISMKTNLDFSQDFVLLLKLLDVLQHSTLLSFPEISLVLCEDLQVMKRHQRATAGRSLCQQYRQQTNNCNNYHMTKHNHAPRRPSSFLLEQHDALCVQQGLSSPFLCLCLSFFYGQPALLSSSFH